jgi:hypothetical protein
VEGRGESLSLNIKEGSPEMGQYFVGVNETKKEFIHPHRFGDGLKFLEFSSTGSGFLAGLALLLRRSNEGGGGDWFGYSAPDKALDEYPIVGSWVGDAVSIVGDYDSSELFQKSLHVPPRTASGWVDVSMPVLAAMAKADSHTKGILKKRLQWTMEELVESDEASDKEELDEYIGIFGAKTFAEEGKGTGKEGNWKVVNGTARSIVTDAAESSNPNAGSGEEDGETSE